MSTFSNNIAEHWWDSTGFLYGNNPSLDVDDPMRISTNIPTFSPPQSWQPLATGVFNIPASVDGAPPTAPKPHALEDGGWASTPITFETVPLAQVDKPNFCKTNCTMGGCSDPTTAIHQQCVAAGCCSLHPPQYNFTPSKNISQMGYGDADCILGPGDHPQDVDGYCRSQYTYKQCNPGSILNAWQDAKCFDATLGYPVPYYVVQ